MSLLSNKSFRETVEDLTLGSDLNLNKEAYNNIIESCNDWGCYKVECDGYENDDIDYSRYINDEAKYLISIESSMGYLVVMSCDLTINCSSQKILNVDLYNCELNITDSDQREILPSKIKRYFIEFTIQETVREQLRNIDI